MCYLKFAVLSTIFIVTLVTLFFSHILSLGVEENHAVYELNEIDPSNEDVILTLMSKDVDTISGLISRQPYYLKLVMRVVTNMKGNASDRKLRMSVTKTFVRCVIKVKGNFPEALI